MSNQRKRVTFQANLAIKFSYDVFCFVISSFLAFLIRFDFSFDVVVISFYRKYISITTITELILGVVFVLIYKTYRDIWHYTSIGEIYKLIRATILEKLIFTFVIFSFSLIGFPKSIFFISPIITFILLVTPRLIGRLLKDERRNGNKLQSGNNTLIIGAGDAGEKIIREIKAHPHLDYNVIGFIDDNPIKHGCYLQGVKVIGDTYSIPKLVEENDIKTILVAIPTAEKSELKRIYDLTSKLPVKLLVLPGIYEIIGGEVTISHIRPFGLEDLLFREQVKLITDRGIKRFNGARVLVTGACGSIGSSICKKLVELGSTVIAFDNNETGIFDLEMELNRYYQSFTTSPLTSFLPSSNPSLSSQDIPASSRDISAPSQDIPASSPVIPAKAGTIPSSQNPPYYPKFISGSNQPPSSPCIPIVGTTLQIEPYVMKDYRPTMFSCAAYKHVPLMEAFPEEATDNI